MDDVVRHVISRLVMVRHVRIMHIMIMREMVWNGREIHVWAEMLGQGTIWQGTC
jgi:hypothetical protein